MNHLRRELAPISARAWESIEDEAGRSVRQFLAGRRLVDFVGPLGWDHSGDRVARVEPVQEGAPAGVDARVRVVPGLVELRSSFRLELAELDDVERGRPDPDLSPVVDAARRAALAEDRLVFAGWPALGIAGIVESSPHEPLPISTDYNAYPATVAKAVALLREAGVAGPYSIALGPRCHTGVIETTERGGYPVLEHIRLILGGDVIWAPSVDGAVVVSLRGGDFELRCGQDLSVGFSDVAGSTVGLYLEETILPRVIEPRAGIALVYP